MADGIELKIEKKEQATRGKQRESVPNVNGPDSEVPYNTTVGSMCLPCAAASRILQRKRTDVSRTKKKKTCNDNTKDTEKEEENRKLRTRQSCANECRSSRWPRQGSHRRCESHRDGCAADTHNINIPVAHHTTIQTDRQGDRHITEGPETSELFSQSQHKIIEGKEGNFRQHYAPLHRRRLVACTRRTQSTSCCRTPSRNTQAI